MAANQTTNYQLNQWEATDQVLRTDFNADNAKIDAALAAKAEVASLTALSETVSGLSSTVAEHAAALDACGNCKIWTTTYQGNGQYGSSGRNSVTFPVRPLFAVVYSRDGILLPIPAYASQSWTNRGETLTYLSWSGNTVSWYSSENSASYQLNAAGSTYFVLALYAAD